MSLHKLSAAITFALSLAALPSNVSGEVLRGFVEPVTPLGQYLSLEMTIGETHTLFKMTGPDYSWFAFGFDPEQGMPPTLGMLGYTIIVEGLDATRTATEYNLLGIGNPGSPQPEQNLEILHTSHDAASDLTTILIRRPNDTGDPLDPSFPRDRNPLPIIWSYAGFSTPDFPSPILNYHGSDGRGHMTIEFTPIPEPSGIALGGLAVGSLLLANRRRRCRGC